MRFSWDSAAKNSFLRGGGGGGGTHFLKQVEKNSTFTRNSFFKKSDEVELVRALLVYS